jgi:hypothetical protein
MPQTPTSLQTETVCQYFTESIKIFTSYATITDKIFLPVYFQREFIFWRSFSVCKTIGILFYFLPIELTIECGITDERYANRCFLSVNWSVKNYRRSGNLTPTD